MADVDKKQRPSPLRIAMQLRGFPEGVEKMIPLPSYEDGFPLPPGAEVAECVCCQARVVMPAMGKALQLAAVYYPCLRGAFNDAKHLEGAPQ